MPAIVITALTDPVAIVHIPTPLTHVFTTKIYWTLDRASTESAEFFNVTANRIEMAIFGSTELITHEWSNLSDPDVLISTPWRVFEISSGDEGEVGNYGPDPLGTAADAVIMHGRTVGRGAPRMHKHDLRHCVLTKPQRSSMLHAADSPHLRHVSAPLAKAGISILYQSSYFTDFLLVKESDFAKAARIFASQGWHFDPSHPSVPRRRSMLTPLTPTFPASSFSPARSSPPPPSSPEITVLPSPLACVGFSRSAEARFSERVRKFLVWPERCSTTVAVNGTDTEDEAHSDVEVVSALTKERPRPFVSFTRNEDGASLVTEVRVLRGMFPPGEEEMDLQSGGELGWESTDDSTYLSDAEIELDSDDQDDQDQKRRRVWTNGQTHTPPPEHSHHPAYRTHRKTHSLPSTPGLIEYERGNLDLVPPFTAGQTGYQGEDGATPGDCRSEHDSEFGVDEIPIRWSGREVRHPEERGKKRCLQLDLRGVADGGEAADADGKREWAYHLDKSGLVNRFSDLLTSSSRPIRMLYSSTFHTANILVEARDVRKAKRLLERRRRSAEWS